MRYLLSFLLLASSLNLVNAQGSNNCLNFDGNQYINANGLLNSLSFQAISVTGWVFPKAPSANHGTIFSFNEDNSSSTNNVNLFYYKDGGFVYFDKAPDNLNIPVSGNFPPEHWYHVALTIDENLNGIIYINGVARLNFDAYELPESGDRFSFGQEWDGNNTSAYYKGKMDEFRVWDKSLTQEEIRTQMCKSIPASTQNLIAYYRFDATGGNSLEDEINVQNDGSLIGFQNSAWDLSGAPIGDASIHLYQGNWDGEELELANDLNKYLKVFNIENNPEGIHIYTVLFPPNSSQGISITGAQEYFGVFASNHEAKYDIEYGFGGYSNGCFDCDKIASIFVRNDNAQIDWMDSNATIDINSCTGNLEDESQVENPYRSEYIMGFSPHEFTLEFPDTLSICDGGELEIDISSPIATGYLWSTGEDAPIVLINVPGIYWFEITAPDCSVVDTIEVNLLPSPSFELGDDYILCNGESLILEPEILNYTSLEWSTGESSPSIEVSTEDSFILTAFNNNCSYTDTIQLTLAPLPNAHLGADTIICEVQSFTLQVPSQDNVNYVWQDGSSSNTFTTTQSGTYSLIAFNDCGEDSDEINVKFEDCYSVYFPNVFTPNNDGINDFFGPLAGQDGQIVLSLKIFDRWGELVFERENFPVDINSGWDGKFKGKHMNSDVYVYLATIGYADGKIEVFSGDLTLIR